MRYTIHILLLMMLLATALPVAAEAVADAADDEEVVIDGAKPTRPSHYDGIDVSSYQKDIDWSTTAKDKSIQYVYVKATEGRDYVSRHYEVNIRNARKHGVKVGAYHFLRTGSSIRAQFENFKRVARKEDQDLIPLIDVEVRNGWTDKQVRDSVKAFADLVEDYYGCKPMIYTSVSFFNKILGRAFADYPLFIARYAANPPVLNGAKWTLWQFSDKGRIRGIDHHVDLSRFNKGCSLRDIAYRPSKSSRSHSVTDEVDRKARPDQVNVGENKVKETPKKSKRQEAEAKKKEEKERKARERAEKMAQDEAKKKAEADRKAKEKQERLKKEEQKRAAKEKATRDAQEAKAARKAQAQKEAQEAKAARKAQAKAAREQREKEQQAKKAAQGNKSTKTRKTSLLQSSKTNLTQSQRNDSVRAAQQKGRKINKSSADND